MPSASRRHLSERLLIAAATVVLITATVGVARGTAPADPAGLADSHGPPPPQYVHFSGHSQAALYMPDPVEFPDPTTGIIIVHRTGNRMTHESTRQLPPRGFAVLGLNTHAANNAAAVDWNQMPIDVSRAVEYMYDEVGMERVVLLGGSGGAPNFAYYQAIAENGLSVCQGPDKIVECPDDDRLVGRPADAIIFRDAHSGNPVERLKTFNPAVKSESNPRNLTADLNPFLEKNGYNPGGCSSYSEGFQRRYFKAQSDRMSSLLDNALRIKADMEAGTHFPADGDSFVAYRQEARLSNLDNTIDGRTLNEQKFVTDEREIVTQVVETVRPCAPDSKADDASYSSAVDVTVDSFLGANSIRSTPAYDIDHCSSNNSTICMVRHIQSPMLTLNAQGHYFIRDGEEIHNNSAASNKDFAVIAGATHGMGNCEDCDGAPYANATRNFYDYVAKWIDTDFTPVTELP